MPNNGERSIHCRANRNVTEAERESLQNDAHFGVLLVDPRGPRVQFQDSSPVGLIADLTKEYLTRSPPRADRGPAHIADSLEPVRMMAGVTVVPTDTYETCPTLDYLWIPGPSPMYARRRLRSSVRDTPR